MEKRLFKTKMLTYKLVFKDSVVFSNMINTVKTCTKFMLNINYCIAILKMLVPLNDIPMCVNDNFIKICFARTFYVYQTTLPNTY